jgi:hypothetical protein
VEQELAEWCINLKKRNCPRECGIGGALIKVYLKKVHKRGVTLKLADL